ncbi:conserved hypothetical protein [Ricinus communis]|uniref:Coenzyme Q-binding protein COQ10 START domain-containing protein n=1 Tax=Ricinus communis TaxID=3988 RepID=B9RN14_RICCO|nr:conserved hypothetical protein [Ricinus communis]|eukprot:XP_002515153.1 uncharacterized protein LOC8270824 [Ricinus communis]
MAQGDTANYVSEDGVFIEVKKLGSNSRSVQSRIVINASFETVWNLMTDYEKFADVVPGLTVCKIIDKKDNFTRVYQMAEQDLPLGMKFKSKMVLDCFEKDIEAQAAGRKRDIEFKMTEGDFKSFQGKWSIEEVTKQRSTGSDTSVGQEYETTLSYLVDVKPKPWLPVHLVEGRLCEEMQTNLLCIREEAQKMIHKTVPAL